MSPDLYVTPDAVFPIIPGNGDAFLSILELSATPTVVSIYDANPEFLSSGFLGIGKVDDIREIEDADEALEVAFVQRKAITVDGASQVVLKIPTDQAAASADWEVKEEYGRVETPWGTGTHKIDGKDYFVAVYTSPKEFPKESERTRFSGLASTKANFTIQYENNEGNETTLDVELDLVTPPVILVHGTFDNPTNCWKTPISPSANTIVQALENKGFKVFTVDYQQTNGQEDTNLSFSEPSSSFESNKKVVYENPGGIRDAIDFYRDDLNIAVTQADVIGHSMGGVLPRVLASDDETVAGRYNDDYYRVENFEAGDINRLISIASTHHGSDMAYLLNFFSTSWKNSDLPFNEKLSNSIIPFLLWVTPSSLTETGAITSQVPSSRYLKRIGPTPIPSHAIVCTVESIGDFESNSGEPETFVTYANIFNAATAFFYFYDAGVRSFLINMLREFKRLPTSLRNANEKESPYPGLSIQATLEASKPSKLVNLVEQVNEGFDAFWQDWHLLMDGSDDNWIIEDEEFVLQYETAEYNLFEEDDDFNNFLLDERWDIISGEYFNRDEIEKDQTQSAIDYLRYLIFKNDLNDGVVRYESQTGGLEKPYISYFDNHIHSYAPRYPEVINRIIELLEGGLKDFNENGFPAAGRKLPIEIPDPDFIRETKENTFDKHMQGCKAVCWSGMVQAHAWAIADLVKEEDVVILARPVNPDATTLIAAGASTKGMNLKGKSADWGPQKGYIPVDQRYSKLWNLYGDDHIRRDTQIINFTKKTTKQLKNSPEEAVARQLTITYDCQGLESFEVYGDTTIENAEKSVFLIQPSVQDYKSFRWDELDDSSCPVTDPEPLDDISHLKTIQVMANPNPTLRDEEGKPRFYTADYDLLAIGFKVPGLAGWEDDPYDIPTQTNFNKEKGFITPEQDNLLTKINAAVKATGYEGGNVSHHGPENQFYILSNPSEGSPYVDYPITAFYKQEGVGKILAIPRGEKGFRDVHLKKFMARKRREGYDLFENIHSPGWAWNHYRKYNYERGWPDRDAPKLLASPEEIPFPANCQCGTKESGLPVDMTNHLPDENIDIGHEFEQFKLYPNPTSDRVTIHVLAKERIDLRYHILSSNGTLLKSGAKVLDMGRSQLEVETFDLVPGLYTLILESNGKLRSKKFNVVR